LGTHGAAGVLATTIRLRSPSVKSFVWIIGIGLADSWASWQPARFLSAEDWKSERPVMTNAARNLI